MELGTIQGSALAAVPVEHLGVEPEGYPQASLQREAGAEPAVMLLMNLFPLEPVTLRRQAATLDPKHDAQGAAGGVDPETADQEVGPEADPLLPGRRIVSQKPQQLGSHKKDL